MRGKLYLIPTTLGENEPLEVMPYSVKTIVELLDHYVVENVYHHVIVVHVTNLVSVSKLNQNVLV